MSTHLVIFSEEGCMARQPEQGTAQASRSYGETWLVGKAGVEASQYPRPILYTVREEAINQGRDRLQTIDATDNSRLACLCELFPQN